MESSYYYPRNEFVVLRNIITGDVYWTTPPSDVGIDLSEYDILGDTNSKNEAISIWKNNVDVFTQIMVDVIESLKTF